MSNPQIVYNSKTINFTADAYRLQFDTPRGILRTPAASGVTEVLNVRADVVISMAFRNFVNAIAADATLKRNLQQWWMWAQAGNAWTLARDSSKTSLTTIASGAAAGDTSIAVASATGLSTGDSCILRSTTHAELVKISGVSGTAVSLTESLNHSYLSGSRFRHEQYWPARLVDARNPVREMPPLHYDVELVFTEDVNAL